MAGRYTGSYLNQCSGWRAVAILADIGQASLVGASPEVQLGLQRRGGNVADAKKIGR
jgi:hypothetical protein